MSALDRLRDRAVQQGMKLLGDPRVMRLLGSRQTQKALMVAFRLPGQIEAAFVKQGRSIARRFKLATREEVERLNATILDLERALHELQTGLNAAGEDEHEHGREVFVHGDPRDGEIHDGHLDDELAGAPRDDAGGEGDR